MQSILPLLLLVGVGCSTGTGTPSESALTTEPCDTVAGWERVTVPFEHFDEPDEAGAGVQLCLPSETKLSASRNVEHAIALNGPEVFAELVLDVRQDFESARDRLTFFDRSFCEADQYSWVYFSVFDWPALEQRFDEVPEGDSELATTGYVHVAVGHHFMSVSLSVVPAGSSPYLDVLSEIGRSLRSQNDAEAVDVDAVLAELTQGRPASCP